MPSRRYRSKRNKSVQESKAKSLVAAVTEHSKITNKKNLKLYKHTISITESDRVIYVYEKADDGKIAEVVDVSYETNVDGSWYTVIRYDSEHGYLHRHDYILDFNKPVVTTLSVRKRGTPGKWLTWAIEDVEDNYIRYRTEFLRKNRAQLTSSTSIR